MNADLLDTLHKDAARFLLTRRTAGKPFGHFNQCAHAYAEDDLSAFNVALELWRMLGLPLSEGDLSYAHGRLQAMQCPETGLVFDPFWERCLPTGDKRHREGDSFFTRAAFCALNAWQRHLDHPVAYLRELTPESLPESIHWRSGAHNPFSVGDLAVLIQHNLDIGVPGADRLHASFLEAVTEQQDPATGLWLAGDPADALTPSINHTFHTIKFTYNVRDVSLPYAEQAVDSCLHACRDDRYYSWETGFACNDLDLALVLYSAALDTDHRRDEIREWARERIPMILDIQKPDGGFSFTHPHAMEQHAFLPVSPGESESDLWGTLMYLGTLHMMVRLGYPELRVPWGTSQVHRVRSGKRI